MALSGLLASASALAQDIKIGFNADLSASPSALAGKAMVPGAEAAVEDINAAGGVLGRKLALVTRDDLGQPQKSMQNISELIDSEKVVAIIGPTNSGNAHTWKHIPNQKKIPDRRGSFRHLGHGADLGRRAQLHVSRLDGRPSAQVMRNMEKISYALVTR